MGRKNEWDMGITNYVGVVSIDETVIKSIELGGKVVLPRTEVGDLGYPVVRLGTEGDKFGLGENKPGSEIR